jgi:oxygen-independent coproporphyrinogen-3 oxidase
MSTPFAVYIHVPFCRQRCSYCSFVSYAGRESDIPVYTDAVIREMEMRPVAGAIITTIYFGGGTPSLLPIASVRLLLDTLHRLYPIASDAEITLEANPGTISQEYLQSLRQMGFNRLSIGVQSLDEAELKLLGRIHTTAEARTAVKQAQLAGFNNISLDLIYGIPGRSAKQWKAMLCEILLLGVQHLSIYGLTLEEGTPLYQSVECGDIVAPDNDTAAAEYEMASKMLSKAGLKQYEISNWALPGYESRHNTAYWQRTPYIGLGAAAHSFLDGQRIANTSALDEYLSCLTQGKLPAQAFEIIDSTTAIAEAVILGLRLNQGVLSDDIQAHFGIDLYCYFARAIEECISLGLLERNGNALRLTPRGRLLGNEVFWRFLP